MNRGASSAYQHTVPTLAFSVGICMGAVLLAYQCFTYLRVGVWLPFSVVDGLAWLGVQWSFLPERWLLAYQFLKAFPLSLAVILVGCGPYLVTLLSTDRTDRDQSI